MAKEWTLKMIKEELDGFLETEESLKERAGSEEVVALFRQRMYSRSFVLKAKADILMWEQGMGERAKYVDEREEGWNKKLAEANEGISLPELASHSLKSRKPNLLRLSSGKTVSVKTRTGIIMEIAEEFIQQGRVTYRDYPTCRKGNIPLLVTQLPTEESAGYYKQSSSDLYVYVQGNSNDCVLIAIQILKHFGEDPAKFHVHLNPLHEA